LGEAQNDLLRQISDEYWNARMSNDPLFATALGDRRFDGKLADITRGGRRRASDEYKAMLSRAEKVEAGKLTEEDRLTLNALVEDIRSMVDFDACGLDDWVVDPLRGPQVEFMNVESYQPVRSPEEGEAMVRRWKAMGPFMADHVRNLKDGLGLGKVAVRASVEKTLEELEDLLGKGFSEWAMMLPAKAPHDDWDKQALDSFRSGIADATNGSVRPEFDKYRTFLRSEVLPRARPDDKPGIMHLPNGMEDYRKLIRVRTSLGLEPQTLHQTGLDEVKKINGEMETLGEKVFGTRDRAEILKRLRTDKSLYFSSRDEIEVKAEEALARARATISKWFGRLPRADCEVVRMKEHEEKNSTIAYYMPPASDGSRPGRYYINTYAPETRPKYEAEALAYHESIPGHHLQIAIAQELEGVPEFRKNSGVTAFIEGWGLYSERLSDEMGLYSSDLDRLGILSYDSWRACRLVVDTGMHAMGWSREAAIEYMFQNSALARNNIVNEVDRYIVWPGQALAYKTGQLEILRLRNEAKSKMGKRFEIQKFHDAVLCNGAVPLETLRLVVGRYASA